MPRAGLSPARVVEVAEQLIDESGQDSLSLAAIAARVGVRVPSLYKHIDGIDSLRPMLAARAKTQFAEALGAASVGLAGRDAVTALARAYREWAARHPGRYAATVRVPRAGDGPDELASERLASLVYGILAGYGLDEHERVHATRLVRSALHGFVALEAGGAFGLPEDVERSFAIVIGSLTSTLAAWPPAT